MLHGCVCCMGVCVSVACMSVVWVCVGCCVGECVCMSVAWVCVCVCV